MKKLLWYALVIICVIILLPLLIVRSCSFTVSDDEEVPQLEPAKISVYISAEKRLVEMQLEEYIKGVIAAEMPADFELEALKAQAVAARTYAFGRITGRYATGTPLYPGADISTDPAVCQAWVSKSNALKKWNPLISARNWAKIEKAVIDTKDIIIVYNGSVVNPVFHSNSGGATENSEDVWDGVAEPYLRSVISPGEESAPDYKSIVTFKLQSFKDMLKKKYPSLSIKTKNPMDSIKTLEYSQGGRVKEIRIGNITMKGTEFRSILSLKSANFRIERDKDGMIKITCLGWGHGVGMSQWGANYMAKKGENFESILKYYYRGIELDTIDSYKLRQAASGL